MRPGTQSSLHPIARHFLQEGGGLESHSSLSAHQGGKLECSVPTQQPLLTTYKHIPLCTALCREVAPQCAVSHSPGQGGDHSCGPAVEPSPAADWPCARDRKPGRAVHACWTPDGLDARGWSSASPGECIMWKGLYRRSMQGHCHPWLPGGLLGRGDVDEPQETGKRAELVVWKPGI